MQENENLFLKRFSSFNLNIWFSHVSLITICLNSVYFSKLEGVFYFVHTVLKFNHTAYFDIFILVSAWNSQKFLPEIWCLKLEIWNLVACFLPFRQDSFGKR